MRRDVDLALITAVIDCGLDTQRMLYNYGAR